MTPIYLNPPSSPFPLEEPSDKDHQDLQLFSTPAQTSSLSCTIFLNPTQDQGGTTYTADSLVQHHDQQEAADPCVSYGGSSSVHQLLTSPSLPIPTVFKLEDKDQDNQRDNNGSSIKWMSSKMRLMRKFMSSTDQKSADKPMRSSQKFQDQLQQLSPFDTDNSSNNSSSNSNNNTVRMCSDCNTTKTPLWRSGPRGPKSLCNACGIRQRKARRAMAAAAAAAETGTILATTNTSSMRSKAHHKEKKSDNGYVAPYKKRCKLASPPRSRKKFRFEDFAISLSKNLAFHQAFPQDEKEAAILLMALSCGLVHG